jgi:ABC-type branched-subunit amino acid transport system substrate-binding protein
MVRTLVVACALALVSCASEAPTTGEAVIVVNVPLARSGALSQQIVNGATLAVEQINAAGGVQIGSGRVRLRVQTLDSGSSPQQSASNAREAVRLKAVAIVDEGTGVDASWRIANDAKIPIGIVYQGAMGLIDPVERPNVFRITPTDRGVAFRLAEYMIPKGLKTGILYDDTSYGAGGIEALNRAFQRNRQWNPVTLQIPSSSDDPSAQVLRARREGATALLVWARPPAIAAVTEAARAAGWTVPIFTPPAGADALVRQQLADHPEWVDGLTVALSRFTSEKGPSFFAGFREAYEKRFGVQKVGVRSNGREVTQALDQAMYAYDFVRVVAAAMARAGVSQGSPLLLQAMEEVEVQGANGDERAFNEKSHEGVVDDDVFFAVFKDMVWTPVQDDPLSRSLSPIDQTA